MVLPARADLFSLTEIEIIAVKFLLSSQVVTGNAPPILLSLYAWNHLTSLEVLHAQWLQKWVLNTSEYLHMY